ncbi:hypothetical protein ES703_70259 [subsurface metagenome]
MKCEYCGAHTGKGFFKDWRAALEIILAAIGGFIIAKTLF